MKHFELEHNGEYLRATWNEGATFNLQTPIGGQWVDYHCFTCYDVGSEQEAIELILETLNELALEEV